jgi:predicted secreted protein
MSALVGRKVTFTPTAGGTPVTGMRTKTITLNNEPIDITSDDDEGFRRFLGADPAERSIDMSVDGVTKDTALIELAAAGGNQLISEYTLDFQGLGSFVGDFFIGSIELGAPYNDAVTFSANIQSSGPFLFTPESDS